MRPEGKSGKGSVQRDTRSTPCHRFRHMCHPRFQGNRLEPRLFFFLDFSVNQAQNTSPVFKLFSVSFKLFSVS